jgi:hypothetical protein
MDITRNKAWWAAQPLWKRVLTLSAAFMAMLAVSLIERHFVSGGVLHANTLLTISLITREALRVLENNLTFTKLVNRQYDDRFGIEGAKIGTTLNVRKPPRYLGRVGQAIAIENAVETSVPVVLNTQRGVDIQFSSQDLALSIDDFSDRFIKPAIASIANAIDADGLSQFTSVYQNVGVPGTVPNALLTYLNAGVKLSNSAAPLDGERYVVVSPQMQATLVDALKGLFQAASAIADQYRKGEMGETAGFQFFMDQNVSTFTVGPQGGAPLVNGANQTGAVLATKGWTAAAAARLVIGDTFTIAGVNQVNPQSRQSVGALQQFVATANFASAADGTGNVNISPAIVTAGAFQTVDASPADAAVITVTGAANTQSPQGLAFHRDWITLACADLPLPGGVDMAARVADKQLGMSIRLVRAYNITTDQFPCRLDILYGWAPLRTELACRVQS